MIKRIMSVMLLCAVLCVIAVPYTDAAIPEQENVTLPVWYQPIIDTVDSIGDYVFESPWIAILIILSVLGVMVLSQGKVN
jgi:hypothetical protein